MDGGYGVADGEARADALALSIGYKDCEQAFASSVFDFMAHSLERGFTELEFYGAKHFLESPFMLPLLEEPSLGRYERFIYNQVKPISANCFY